MVYLNIVPTSDIDNFIQPNSWLICYDTLKFYAPMPRPQHPPSHVWNQFKDRFTPKFACGWNIVKKWIFLTYSNTKIFYFVYDDNYSIQLYHETNENHFPTIDLIIKKISTVMPPLNILVNEIIGNLFKSNLPEPQPLDILIDNILKKYQPENLEYNSRYNQASDQASLFLQSLPNHDQFLGFLKFYNLSQNNEEILIEIGDCWNSCLDKIPPSFAKNWKVINSHMIIGQQYSLDKYYVINKAFAIKLAPFPAHAKRDIIFLHDRLEQSTNPASIDPSQILHQLSTYREKMMYLTQDLMMTEIQKTVYNIKTGNELCTV